MLIFSAVHRWPSLLGSDNRKELNRFPVHGICYEIPLIFVVIWPLAGSGSGSHGPINHVNIFTVCDFIDLVVVVAVRIENLPQACGSADRSLIDVYRHIERRKPACRALTTHTHSNIAYCETNHVLARVFYWNVCLRKKKKQEAVKKKDEREEVVAVGVGRESCFFYILVRLVREVWMRFL